MVVREFQTFGNVALVTLPPDAVEFLVPVDGVLMLGISDSDDFRCGIRLECCGTIHVVLGSKRTITLSCGYDEEVVTANFVFGSMQLLEL